MLILIIDHHGNRLCKDGYFRSFAMFGSFGSCVKQYRSLPHAHHRAAQLSYGNDKARVVIIPDDCAIEAGGRVIRTVPCPDKPDYHTNTHHQLEEFVVSKECATATTKPTKPFDIPKSYGMLVVSVKPTTKGTNHGNP